MVKLKLITGLCIAAVIMTAFFLLDTRAYAKLTEPKVALADFDDRLTEQQEKEITSLMTQAAEKTQFHIAIIIANDLNGMSDTKYTDTFGYSVFGNSDWITLMIFNSYDKPEYTRYSDVISRNGRADDVLKKYDGRMLDSIYSVLEHNAYKDYNSDDIYHLFNYYGACKSFCASVEKYGVTTFGNVLMSYIQDHIGTIFICFVAAVIVAVVITTTTIRGYKKRKPISASNYIDQSRTRITRQVDQFVREYTTSVNISSNTSSGGGRSGGGGGGHHSSSHGHHR